MTYYKFYLCIAVGIIFFSSTCIAKLVSIKKAKTVAVNLFSERTGFSTEILSIDNFFIDKEFQDTLFYIINISDPISGFVIVSADDATIPVLGYVLHQKYLPQKHPIQFDEMLDSFRKQILMTKKNKVAPVTIVSEEWARLSIENKSFKGAKQVEYISPLLSTNWNQNWPYNELCPADANGPGGHAYAGCVAVAMSQVMKYWSHPSHGTGSHGYSHYQYGYLFADFEATTYSWENMPHSISTSNIDLSTVMYHCGVAVEMNYGASGSGSNLEGYNGACEAFKNYFNYDANAYHAKKYQYEDTTWRNLIVNELSNGRPVVYGGWDGWTGHAWNLDGFEKVGDVYHYHMNWGWSSSYNGYFYLDDLSPGYHNYTSGQEAIFDLYPYAANKISCYPQNGNYWTGTTNSSNKTETSLIFGTDPEDGWMSFDISAIPDGSTIYAVSFNGFVYERYKPNWSITPVTANPISTDPATLHSDIVAEQLAGYYFHQNETNINYPVDWRIYMLEGTVSDDLQASLSGDKFTLGIANDYSNSSRFIRFHGWNEANKPFLNVYYTAFGSLEGSVTAYGTSTPIENVHVSIGHFTDTTDFNGYYSFESVPIGNYTAYFDANENLNGSGNPFFNDSLIAIIEDGITAQADMGLKWSELELTPDQFNITIDPEQVKTEQFTITNNGPGQLDFYCFVSAEHGNVLKDLDIETEANDGLIYGSEFDGKNIWATGAVSNYGDHQIYKFNKKGNLLAQYSQGTLSSFGMRQLTWDGDYLYSSDPFGFYKIDTTDGSVETLFTNFPAGIYGGSALAWVPNLGFVSVYQDDDFVIFDETGTLLGTMHNPGLFCRGLTWDPVNNCLWLGEATGCTYHGYDTDTESLTGVSYTIPMLDGLSYQSAGSACFAIDLVEGKTTLCGTVLGNPVNKFFALELQTWLKIDDIHYGTVPGTAKASIDIDIQMTGENMIVAQKSADIVVAHNAGENDTLPITINNSYTYGTIYGYVKEFGTGQPIQAAIVAVGGQSDLTDGNGYYSLSNIPIGQYMVNISSADYIDDTLLNVPVTGPPSQLDISLKWTELNFNPSSFAVNLGQNDTLGTSINLSNNGPGNLIYNCEIVFFDNNKSPDILLVDRDMSCFFNGEEEYADASAMYMNALNAIGSSYTYYEVFLPWIDGPDLLTLQQYDIVIWFSGEAYSDDCMTVNDETNLAAYLDGGGKLLFSSQGYLSKYGWGNFSLNPGDFAYDYLGLRTVESDKWYIWGPGEMEGMPGSLADGQLFDIENYFMMEILGPYEIQIHAGIDLFQITDPFPEGVCAIQYQDSDFKTIFTSCSLAAIEDPDQSGPLMASIIGYFEGNWLYITSNESGIVPGESKNEVAVGLLFDSGGLAEDTYQAEIHLNSNDADTLVVIPVQLIIGEVPSLELKVYLEGAYNGSLMKTLLNDYNLLPLSQPFDIAPWNYFGGENVGTVPDNQIVDWVLIEYRDALDAASAGTGSRIGRQAAFVKSDGLIVGLDGVTLPSITANINNHLYLVVSHRNHIEIMSADSVKLANGKYSYDFTSNETQVFGGADGHKELAPGVWGMIAGNGLTDGVINIADDTACWRPQAGQGGYLPGDFNLDATSDNIDKNDFWFPNLGKGSQVPD